LPTIRPLRARAWSTAAGILPGIEVVAEAATQRLAQTHPDIAVVVLTSRADDDTVQAALAAGARGFVTKSAGRAQIAQAVHAAAAEPH
jgi:DNA-binding NarL/FixJ family response regulator